MQSDVWCYVRAITILSLYTSEAEYPKIKAILNIERLLVILHTKQYQIDFFRDCTPSITYGMLHLITAEQTMFFFLMLTSYPFPDCINISLKTLLKVC